jgi:PadR family transcriptional regulator PadR
MLILKALSLGPLHGCGVVRRIRQLSDELLEVEQGSLYPAVYRTRAARLDQFQVGGARDRPPGRVLHVDSSGE